MHDKCLVKMEKALNLNNKVFSDRDHIHISFITEYCCNWSILLVIVNILLCLIYELYFKVGKYDKGKNIAYIGFCGFRHPRGFLEHIPLGERKTLHCFDILKLLNNRKGGF